MTEIGSGIPWYTGEKAKLEQSTTIRNDKSTRGNKKHRVYGDATIFVETFYFQSGLETNEAWMSIATTIMLVATTL